MAANYETVECGGCAPPVYVRDKELATVEAGEAVWMFKDDDGKWRNFLNDKHREDTIADGRWEVRAFYPCPAPAAPVSDEAGEAVAPFGWVRYHQKHGYTFNLGHKPLGDETGLGWRDVPLYTRPAPAAEAAPQGGVDAATLNRWRTMIDYAPSEVQAEITAALAATPPSAPAVEGCGACSDGCRGRPSGCRLAEESPPQGDLAATLESVADEQEAAPTAARKEG